MTDRDKILAIERRPLLTTFMMMAVGACARQSPARSRKKPIDRRALVKRHSPAIDAIDPMSPFMVGNGEFAIAVDITGLQTFRAEYSEHSPLMTQAQWAWHSFPNLEGYDLSDAMKPVEVHRRVYEYPYIKDWSELDENPALRWLRENPHRYSLGRLSFKLSDGDATRFSDVQNPKQTLDLWSGEIRSAFVFEGEPVAVSTRTHPARDMIITEIASPLVAKGRLGVELAFPYVSTNLNPDPADWDSPDRHETTEIAGNKTGVVLKRVLDSAEYWVAVASEGGAKIYNSGAHRYAVFSDNDRGVLRIMVEYGKDPIGLEDALSFEDAVHDSQTYWEAFWTTGGAMDFSESADPRAHELERRIVLSQYLTAANCAGSYIPQEEGLYSNSWNGKFHHEMHWWHAAHFALWGREDLLQRSMGWYEKSLPEAKARAAHYGRSGAWWPKMTGPDARESPSTINPFIMWQQPHPIYLAELLYRATPVRETLKSYQKVVFETADLLAAYPYWDEKTQRYVIGPPIMPAQETYDPQTTFNPAFELAYFGFGLRTAQLWRERLGLRRNEKWDHVLDHLSPLPQRDGLYIGAETVPDFWTIAPSCGAGYGKSGGVANGGPLPDATCLNRDHPSFLAAFGWLPGDMTDADAMKRTFGATDDMWDFRQTWGWDYPMLAMTAARLGEPDKAIDYLLLDAPNNQYGRAGMTPRYHLGANGYQKDADTYFPSNGALLAAAAMMAAGWDGAPRDNPGFPDDGSWVVRWEGLRPLP